MSSRSSLRWSIALIALSLVHNANAQESAGKTIMARGAVKATNDTSGVRDLRRRSPVYKVDSVNTGEQSATQLRMLDGGLLSLQAETQLAISEYDFNADTQQGSVSMQLVKGGLRTVTGALQSNETNYRLNTPVASIGVRGTHYEAEMFEDDLYLAGWEGTIYVFVPLSNIEFNLGPEEDYRFAIVKADGTVEFVLEAPVTFTEGHSNDLISAPDIGQLDPQFALYLGDESEDEIDFEPLINIDTFGEEFIDNDRLISRITPDDDQIFRTGSAIFDQLTNADFSSSNGLVTNINMSISVNFTTSAITSGNLSFEDNGGEWFAAFNGLISANALDVNINFASYNNNLVSGEINGLFIDNSTSILGTVDLFQINEPSVQAGGSFLLTELASEP